MSAKNDITGDAIYSVPTEAYRNNFEDIFKMKEIDGFWWPRNDKDCHPAVLKEVYKIGLLDKYLKKKDVVIQAGGNVGVFPRELAKSFKEVYTFEPDRENFDCLVRNCPEDNIFPYYAALGKDNKKIRVGVSRDDLKNNCGAYQVLGEGDVDTIKIDDLNLEPDLIYLDIEGYELFALQGGFKTIKRCHPVIVVENKQLPLMYDTTPEEVIEYLVCMFGYEVKEKVMRDVILA